MVSAAAVRFGVGVLGNVIAFFLFLSPVPTFIQIVKKGSVEQYSPVPYLATFINCMLWVLYGLPMVKPDSTLVVTINGAGVVIEIVYLSLFVYYSDHKRQKLKVAGIAAAEVVTVGLLAALVLSLAHTTHLRTQVVGMVAIVSNIMMYAAPLSVMKLVITTKSVEYMPFFLSLASFANGIAWTVYAIRPFDPYIAAPNGLGSLFGLGQLILYGAFYKSTKQQIAARKAKEAEIGLTTIVVGQESSNVRPQNGPGSAKATETCQMYTQTIVVWAPEAPRKTENNLILRLEFHHSPELSHELPRMPRRNMNLEMRKPVQQLLALFEDDAQHMPHENATDTVKEEQLTERDHQCILMQKRTNLESFADFIDIRSIVNLLGSHYELNDPNT
ncbi:hypothetical protein V2J09_020173 [Rumex salicifolius]